MITMINSYILLTQTPLLTIIHHHIITIKRYSPLSLAILYSHYQPLSITIQTAMIPVEHSAGTSTM